MELGHLAVVAGDEAVDDVGEEAPLLARDPAHDAEIDGDDVAGLGIGEEIARMHVGMEVAVADRVPEEVLQEVPRQLLAVEAGRIERGVLADRDAVHPVRRQHGFGGLVPDDFGDGEAFVLLDVAAELRDRRALEPEVELEQRRALERLRRRRSAGAAVILRRDAFERAARAA